MIITAKCWNYALINDHHQRELSLAVIITTDDLREKSDFRSVAGLPGDLVVYLHDTALLQLPPLVGLDQLGSVLDHRVQEDSLHAAVEPDPGTGIMTTFHLDTL